MQCIVLTLLDFSKTYDTIWREKLLLCMLDAGIPMTFIRWLCSFLTDYRAHVQLVCGFSRRFNQGLLQGSALIPLLFSFYINNLADKLSDDAAIALLGDDVSILTTAHKKEYFIAAVQSEANKVYN